VCIQKSKTHRPKYTSIIHKYRDLTQYTIFIIEQLQKIENKLPEIR